MKCNTRDFGEVSYNQQDVINFTQPPFGFEEYKDYIILLDDQVKDSICWLQSIDNEALCFIIIDTFSAYNGKMPADVFSILGEGRKSVFGICVITDDIKKSTVNLKSPIIINDDTHKAVQLILSGDYKIKQPLFESEV